MLHILGIDTSCDDSGVGVVSEGRWLRSNVIASQAELHRVYGGVVPEVASRAHLVALPRVLVRALEEAGIGFKDLGAVAVTQGPGLVGALLVGVAAAKALAYALRVPLIPVHHLLGHLYSAWLAHPDLPLPAVGLLASGGHTLLLYWEDYLRIRVIGGTLDDAAGEAFDKVARFLGLGYPGGPALEKAAAGGDPGAFPFPRVLLGAESLDFSFSGLKTAVVNFCRRRREAGEPVPLEDVAASFQAAVVEVLVEKCSRALKVFPGRSLVVVGGVAANRTLRQALEEKAREEGWELVIPPPALCTDNGAMIAAAGYFLYQQGRTADFYLEAVPGLKLETFLCG
ncbi:MAG: tRNA (adenosine(37)-N6)-threonylcarbamoyltransferase complex transferase subunit TsaD [Moorellales bacterium]